MGKIIDLTGKKFGKWTVVGKIPHRGHNSRWLCVCDCGTEKEVLGFALKQGSSTSCGCKPNPGGTTHGLWGSRFYKMWDRMHQRCYNSNNPKYRIYGGKGVTICDEWRHHPETFISWCKQRNPAPGLSIDRINSNGNYCPENCRFVDAKQQARNISTNVWIKHNGQNMIFRDLVATCGVVSFATACRRVYRDGWDHKLAAITPPLRTGTHPEFTVRLEG